MTYIAHLYMCSYLISYLGRMLGLFGLGLVASWLNSNTQPSQEWLH